MDMESESCLDTNFDTLDIFDPIYDGALKFVYTNALPKPDVTYTLLQNVSNKTVALEN